MIKTLVTGAGGFIGSWAVNLLCEKGMEVHTVELDLKSKAIHPAAITHTVDLMDAVAVRRLIKTIRPEKLIHLAWITTPGIYWTSHENFLWVEASLRLVREFVESGGQRIVCAGSCAEYDWRYGFLSEDVTPIQPRSPYGTCKNAFHEMLRSYASLTGVSYAWGRIFFLYGPGEHQNRLVSSIIRAIGDGQPIPPINDQQVRDFLYVADVANAFVALALNEHPGPVNIASGHPVEIGHIAMTISEKMGRRDLLGPRRESPGEGPPLLVGDARKLNTFWTPIYDLASGIEATINQLDRHES